MHQGLHSNWSLSGWMYHRFGIIMESYVIRSRELTNTLKSVGIGFNEVFAGVEWRSEDGWVTSTGEFKCAVQLDIFPVLMRKGNQVWLVQDYLLHTISSGHALSAVGPWGSIQWQCLGLQIVECLIHCMPSVWCHRGGVWLACHP